MIFQCKECKTGVEVTTDNVAGEIMPCPSCGLDYVIAADEKGHMILEELAIEGEDWGE